MGCKKDIKTEMQIRCFDCFGHGNVETSQTCEVCAGSGVKTSKQKSGFFASMLQTQCGECGGSGKKIDSCQSCGGAGSIRYTFEDVLETTPNNPLGRKYNRIVQDVSIEFSVRVIVDIPPGFRTENNPPQLVTTVTLPLIDFLLGGSKSILIDDECGNVDFQFSSLQKEVVVDAKGLPKNGRRDSLKIILEPELPKKITEEQKELLNKLKQAGL
jgi:DnaJ-class molecular chaperone